MRISDWSSDVCSSDLDAERERTGHPAVAPGAGAPVKAAPAHLAARPAAEDAVPPLEAVHQRPAAAGDRVLRRRASDRKSVVLGKSGSVRVDLGGRRIMHKRSTQVQ